MTWSKTDIKIMLFWPNNFNFITFFVGLSMWHYTEQALRINFRGNAFTRMENSLYSLAYFVRKINDGYKSSTWIRHLICPINYITDLSSWSHFSRIYIHTKTYLELATCCKTRSRWWWSLTRLSSTRSLADVNRIFTTGIFIPTKSLTMDG